MHSMLAGQGQGGHQGGVRGVIGVLHGVIGGRHVASSDTCMGPGLPPDGCEVTIRQALQGALRLGGRGGSRGGSRGGAGHRAWELQQVEHGTGPTPPCPYNPGGAEHVPAQYNGGRRHRAIADGVGRGAYEPLWCAMGPDRVSVRVGVPHWGPSLVGPELALALRTRPHGRVRWSR